ncbi:unnamed protein product [Mytilus coruscus]|uniref:Uncharacterized protein n=1 Tax=Mytilus coruscus TaxID=42192 RepID=A0A6J8D047_MYTCO|nr:unnamed protein product [Mytilus coruscus]
MPKRKKRQNVPYHRKRRGTGKSKLDKGQTEIHALTPDIAHDEDLLPSETEELTCRNKRNPDLNPYNSPSDERLRWLKEDFLNYFSEWEQAVMNRVGNFTLKERKGMLLSHQTITGLKISVHSIVASVKFLLNSVAKFVLTHSFNQDPLEQEFGHYRHRVGDNSNPTVYEVRHMMNQMRAVGAVALAPKRGNIHRQNDENRFVIDNSKLPKR